MALGEGNTNPDGVARGDADSIGDAKSGLTEAKRLGVIVACVFIGGLVKFRILFRKMTAPTPMSINNAISPTMRRFII
jgi:hypothetical protein